MTRQELQRAVDLHLGLQQLARDLGPAPEAAVVRRAVAVLQDIISADVDALGRIPPHWQGYEDQEAARRLAEFDAGRGSPGRR